MSMQNSDKRQWIVFKIFYLSKTGISKKVGASLSLTKLACHDCSIKVSSHMSKFCFYAFNRNLNSVKWRQLNFINT